MKDVRQDYTYEIYEESYCTHKIGTEYKPIVDNGIFVVMVVDNMCLTPWTFDVSCPNEENVFEGYNCHGAVRYLKRVRKKKYEATVTLSKTFEDRKKAEEFVDDFKFGWNRSYTSSKIEEV